jgi:hypothetical protein
MEREHKKPGRPFSANPRDKRCYLRVTDEELQRVRLAAELLGVPASDFWRDVVLKAAARVIRGKAARTRETAPYSQNGVSSCPPAASPARDATVDTSDSDKLGKSTEKALSQPDASGYNPRTGEFEA